MSESVELALAEIKAKKIEILEQIRKHKAEHQLQDFVPHARQSLFFDALKDPTIKTLVLLGGNRSGKTTASVASAVCLAQGRLEWIPRPKPIILPAQPMISKLNDHGLEVVYRVEDLPADLKGWTDTKTIPAGKVHRVPTLTRRFKTPEEFKVYRTQLATPSDPGALRFQPPIKIRILGEDMTALEKVQIPKLKQYIAPEWLSGTKKNSFGVINQWVFANGSTIELLTYQQESAMMEGWDGHVVVYDEPPPRSHYIANSRGLIDHNGISIFSLTPLKEPWVADEIVNKPDPSIWCMTMDTRENPHLSEAAIAEFESRLSDEEKETRLAGKFLHLQGLVFKEFNKQIHLKACRDIEPDSTVYVSIDTHPRTEQAMIWMKVDKRGNMFVVKEHFRHGPPDYVADQIIEFHKSTHRIERAIIDPSSKGDTNRGKSTFEIIEDRLADHGIILELGSKDLSGGILQMQDAFMSRNHLPSLFIDPTCERLVWELTRYVWADWKAGGATDKGERNKPIDRDDHLIECTRRLIQLPAEYVNPRSGSEFLNRRYWPIDSESGYLILVALNLVSGMFLC